MNKESKRKAKRIERKKRKIVAFLEVAQLNEDDRKAKKVKIKEVPTESNPSSTVAPALKTTKIEEAVLTSETSNPTLNEGVNHSNGQHCPDLSELDSSYVNCDISELKRMLWEKKMKLINEKSDLSDQKPSYVDKDINELKRMLREKRKKLSQIPKFRLKESGNLASLNMSDDHRIPLFMVDVQHLIMWSLLGHHSPFDPSRWYTLQKYNRLSHTVVLAVDGISVNDLQSAEGFLQLPSTSPDQEPIASQSAANGLFPWKLEFIGPLSYGSNLVQEIATVPLSNTQYERVVKTHGNLEKALKGKAVYKVFRSMFPIEAEGKSGNTNEVKMENAPSGKEKIEEIINTQDKFPRTQLLLSADQMIQIGYPLPLVKNADGVKQPLVVPNVMNEEDAKIIGSVGTLLQSTKFMEHLNKGQLQGGYGCAGGNFNSNPALEKITTKEENDVDEDLYIFSRPSYKEVGPNSPMFAVDCEMCQTGDRRSELTRISIVNEDLEVVYESLVKPYRKITNYLTRFSGITEKMLKGVKTRLKDVQRDVRNLLPPDAILVGQSLNFDLHAMKMMHPYVIDTSVVYNLSGIRSRRTKLATLSRLFLSENIQCAGPKGHDSVEDAQAAMKLVLLKLSNNIHYGDAVISDRLTREASNQHSVESKSISKESKMSFRKMKMMQDLQIGKNGEKAFATSIFTHFNRGKHAAAVIGVNDAIREYESYVGQENPKKDSVDHLKHSEGTPPKILSFGQSSEVVTHACEIMLEYQLCIVHVANDSVGEKLKALQKWCRKLVKHSAPNSLCIVVLGGTEHSNGACLINVKGPSDEVT